MEKSYRQRPIPVLVAASDFLHIDKNTRSYSNFIVEGVPHTNPSMRAIRGKPVEHIEGYTTFLSNGVTYALASNQMYKSKNSSSTTTTTVTHQQSNTGGGGHLSSRRQESQHTLKTGANDEALANAAMMRDRALEQQREREREIERSIRYDERMASQKSQPQYASDEYVTSIIDDIESTSTNRQPVANRMINHSDPSFVSFFTKNVDSLYEWYSREQETYSDTVLGKVLAQFCKTEVDPDVVLALQGKRRRPSMAPGHHNMNNQQMQNNNQMMNNTMTNHISQQTPGMDGMHHSAARTTANTPAVGPGSAHKRTASILELTEELQSASGRRPPSGYDEIMLHNQKTMELLTMNAANSNPEELKELHQRLNSQSGHSRANTVHPAEASIPSAPSTKHKVLDLQSRTADGKLVTREAFIITVGSDSNYDLSYITELCDSSDCGKLCKMITKAFEERSDVIEEGGYKVTNLSELETVTFTSERDTSHNLSNFVGPNARNGVDSYLKTFNGVIASSLKKTNVLYSAVEKIPVQEGSDYWIDYELEWGNMGYGNDSETQYTYIWMVVHGEDENALGKLRFDETPDMTLKLGFCYSYTRAGPVKQQYTGKGDVWVYRAVLN